MAVHRELIMDIDNTDLIKKLAAIRDLTNELLHTLDARSVKKQGKEEK